MPGLISTRHNDDVDLELFYNTISKFTPVLMGVMVLLLVINVGHKPDHIISTYRASGGSVSPQSYLGVYEIKNSDSAFSVDIISPSYQRGLSSNIRILRLAHMPRLLK
jgi:hypothetical protein